MNIANNQNNKIINTYSNWSINSKLHNISAMESIINKNSSFSEITNLCKKSWAIGIDCYYEFSSVKVIKIINTPHSAFIEGDIRLIQSNKKLNFKGKFKSSCLFETIDNNRNSWKLNELEIDWEL